MSRVIRSENLNNCQSWQLPDMGNGDNASSGSARKLLTASDIERTHDDARKEGFQQGLKEGLAAGEKEINDKILQFENLLHALEKPFELLDDVVEQQLVQLSMCVAKQIVRRELSIEESQVVGIVKEALSALPVASQKIQINLHPQDAQIVRDALSVNEEKQNLHIVEDLVLTRGDCKVLTETSQIDLTVESRLNAIIANVLGGERSSDGSPS